MSSNPFNGENLGLFEEKDYIMKMIRQFTNAIARIMGLKAESKILREPRGFKDTLKNFTGLNIEVLEALPYEILMQKVSGSRQINTVKSLVPNQS